MTNKEAIELLKSNHRRDFICSECQSNDDECKSSCEYGKALNEAIKALECGTQGEWIPIKYRPLTAKERIAFAEHYGIEYCDTSEEKAFDCPMPEDKQEILISTSWGVVEDVADNDIDGEGFICYGLEINGDWDCVEAWMPKPKPYTKEATNDK